MQRRQYKYYRIISVMFWAFPYLLWQAFGNISGFFVGVVLALILTLMLNSLFRLVNRNTSSNATQLPIGATGSQSHHQDLQRNEAERYQQGYHAETEPYQAQAGKHQPQYEEMQVQYPQEMPPIPL